MRNIDGGTGQKVLGSSPTIELEGVSIDDIDSIDAAYCSYMI